MSRIHAARMDSALQGLLFMATWHDGWLPVRLGSWPPQYCCWRSWREPRWRDLAGLVQYLDERHSDDVLLGIPQHRPDNGGVTQASILWCRVETGEQYQRALRFRPLPSMVLREGSSLRRWLIWSLEESVPWSALKAANRKIAYALGAKQLHGDPDRVWLPAPGTCVRTRARPVPVVCARLEPDSYSLDAVVGRLKEPPDLAAWWEGRTG